MASIEKLIFNENSVQIYLDTTEVLTVSYNAYMKYNPSSGTELSRDRYFELFDESEKYRCRELSFRYLSIRNRSTLEMQTYLKKKKFESRIIDEILSFLKEKEYLNDRAFADMYISSKMKNGKYGKDLIVRGLYQKGVKKDVIDEAIKSAGAERADIESLFVLARKKYDQVKEKKDPLIKVSNYLRGRGFVYEDIKAAIKAIGAADFD